MEPLEWPMVEVEWRDPAQRSHVPLDRVDGFEPVVVRTVSYLLSAEDDPKWVRLAASYVEEDDCFQDVLVLPKCIVQRIVHLGPLPLYSAATMHITPPGEKPTETVQLTFGKVRTERLVAGAAI